MSEDHDFGTFVPRHMYGPTFGPTPCSGCKGLVELDSPQPQFCKACSAKDAVPAVNPEEGVAEFLRAPTSAYAARLLAEIPPSSDLVEPARSAVVDACKAEFLAALKPMPALCSPAISAEIASLSAALSKPTNPKDLIGTNKVPLSIVPETATAYASLGLLEGALKYGANNWRHTGVRASVYLDALDRHIAKWRNGEECDPVTKVPHLGNALACLCILVDAKEAGKLTDDRPLQAPVAETIDRLAETVKHLRLLFADYAPTHYLHITPTETK